MYLEWKITTEKQKRKRRPIPPSVSGRSRHGIRVVTLLCFNYTQQPTPPSTNTQPAISQTSGRSQKDTRSPVFTELGPLSH